MTTALRLAAILALMTAAAALAVGPETPDATDAVVWLGTSEAAGHCSTLGTTPDGQARLLEMVASDPLRALSLLECLRADIISGAKR